ncbi:MAG: transketolase family protein [Candidatus Pacebacteria bacterium]|nr:transketolase family protein [Candidatus Paceibacterota bacterium]
MFTTDISLHEGVFNEHEALPQRALRDGFGDGIVEAAMRDERIVVLCADVTDSVRLTAFKERFPERYIECGVSEQNMAAVAAGLAQYGKIPYIVAYAAFSPGRNWEQIRTTIALSELPVKVVGMHTGVTVGPDGATHQALEDITLMRVLPNMRIVVPFDAEEARKATLAIATNGKPTYLRLSREGSPVVTTGQTPFMESRAYYVWRSGSPRVAIIGAGPILYAACEAAKRLQSEGVETSVLNIHTIKPIDIDAVKGALYEARAVVTVEDHQILGGIGSTIAEIAAQNTPVPIEMVAVHDRFGQSGTPKELLSTYGLDVDAIVAAVRRVRARRSD